jgi:ATP-dependent protease Clp ATPase subunit
MVPRLMTRGGVLDVSEDDPYKAKGQILSEEPGPCSFCGRSRKQVARLIAGPEGAFICEQCVAHASELAAERVVEDRAAAPMLLEAPASEVRCSFCGKQARQLRHVVASGLAGAPAGKSGQDGTRICDQCLALCEEILAETAPP